MSFLNYIAKPFTREQIKEKMDEVFKVTTEQKNMFTDISNELYDTNKPLNEINIGAEG